MHGLDTGTAQLELQAQVEIGRIDTDKNIRLRGDQIASQRRRRPSNSNRRPSTSTRPITAKRSIGK